MTWIAIMIGGALGAAARHGLNIWVTGAARGAYGLWAPLAPHGGILLANVIGSFAMGLAVGVFAHVWQPPQEVKILLTTGFLGAFTTFSTFSLDAAVLIESGQAGAAAAYMALSVAGALLALFAGLYLIRLFFAG